MYLHLDVLGKKLSLVVGDNFELVI